MRAAAAGAAIARGWFGRHLGRVRDAGVDFTTDADVETERAIRATLGKLRPEDAILGEELGRSGVSTRRWLVDPICGTLNFAARTPLFAVNVALESGGDTVAAAVVDPIADDAFVTDGTTAWRHSSGIDSTLMPTSSSRLVCVNLENPYPNASALRLLSDEPFRARFSPRVLSTTLALAWVASGQQAAYVTGGDLRASVHWTAGIALCRAAGVVVTNLAGQELHTGDHGMVAAADPDTHAVLIRRLRALR